MRYRIIMSANIAAIYGAQLFQEDDRPRYRRAFGLNSGLLGLALVLAAGRYLYEKLQKKKEVPEATVESSEKDRKQSA